MKIFEIDIPKLLYSDFFWEITKYIEEKNIIKGKSIFTPNPEICLETLSDKAFLDTLQQADYLTSDGIGLFLAYQIEDFMKHTETRGIKRKIQAFFLLPYFILRLLFQKEVLYSLYGERICGSTITEDLLYFCEKKAIPIAILDPYFPHDVAKCESQRFFSENLKKVFPKLNFEYHIYTEVRKTEIFEKIRENQAKVLFSTLWMKRQEYSIIEALNVCPNIHLGLAVGSSFDYFTGFQKRAPEIFRSLGFEWVYRIFTSPNKLKRLKRIYHAVVIFPCKVIYYER